MQNIECNVVAWSPTVFTTLVYPLQTGRKLYLFQLYYKVWIDVSYIVLHWNEINRFTCINKVLTQIVHEVRGYIWTFYKYET